MQSHLFHIPVMGLGYTLDTPIKVAKYGISSAISIVQDDVIEKIRKYYTSQYPELTYQAITKGTANYRSKRITAYLNLLQYVVSMEFEKLKKDPIEVKKYFSFLPGTDDMTDAQMMEAIQQMKPGAIDANIMTKLDRTVSGDENALSEACSALQGFALSDVQSSIILSAGFNPRLFAYIAEFEDFMPDNQGHLRKKVTLKVSDYRSALVQGKMLAKKGIWVSEFRIESGLNCGGHAFATQGNLMGPILEEFKNKRTELANELFALCNQQLAKLDQPLLTQSHFLLTVQGGIGTSKEREFLQNQYQVDSTGWGSPFLLVPEATSIDDETLQELIHADETSIYQSDASPLGVKFNSIRNNNADRLRQQRIAEGNPGSPCVRKHLALSTDEHGQPTCLASRKHQSKLIDELKVQNLDSTTHQKAFDSITSKECLCNGLSLSLLRKMGIEKSSDGQSISVCPGPNLAYFDRSYTLKEMVDHIYGKTNIIDLPRPNLFLKELGLYLNHLQEEISIKGQDLNKKAIKYIDTYFDNLQAGIDYYHSIKHHFMQINDSFETHFEQELNEKQEKIESIWSAFQEKKAGTVDSLVTT